MGTVKIIYITISKNYKTNWTKLGVPANEMNFLHIWPCFRVIENHQLITVQNTYRSEGSRFKPQFVFFFYDQTLLKSKKTSPSGGREICLPKSLGQSLYRCWNYKCTYIKIVYLLKEV